MKRLGILFFFTLLFCNLSYGQEKIKIAVLDFPVIKGVISKDEAPKLTKKIAEELSKFDDFEVIAGEELNTKMKLLKLSPKKLTPAKLKNMGEKLELNYIIQSEILQAVNVGYTHDPRLGTENNVYDISGLNTAKIEKYTDEYDVRIFIIDVKDGSARYLVVERNEGKDFEKMMPKLSEKIHEKITTQPVEIVKISDNLYLFPNEMGPFEIVEGYRICNEMNQRKIYGYGDWRPPTTEEMSEIVRYYDSKGVAKGETYILDESNKIFNAIERREEKMKIGFGFSHEDYNVYRGNEDYKTVWGKHYLRLVRGQVPFID